MNYKYLLVLSILMSYMNIPLKAQDIYENNYTFKFKHEFDSIVNGSSFVQRSVAVGDVLGTGESQILVGINNQLYVYEIRDSELILLNDYETDGYIDEIKIKDTDNDNKNEVILRYGDKITIYKISAFLNAVFTFQGKWPHITVEDINGNGKNELIFTTSNREDGGIPTLEIYEFSTNSYNQKSNYHIFDDYGFGLTHSQFGDLDGDGQGELILGNDNGFIWIYRVVGYSLELLYKEEEDPGGAHRLRIGNFFDFHSGNEVIRGTNGGWIEIVGYSSDGNKIKKDNAVGWRIDVGRYAYSIEVANLDHDETSEFAVSHFDNHSGDNPRTALYNYDGNLGFEKVWEEIFDDNAANLIDDQWKVFFPTVKFFTVNNKINMAIHYGYNLYFYESGINVSNEDELAINTFKLNQNYPNPFNPTTNIRFELPESSFVTLEVHNILGQQVAKLVNERKSPGHHEVNFDASNLSSGVYLYRLNTDSYMETRQMMLIK